MKRFVLIAVMLFAFGGAAVAQMTNNKVAVYVTGDADNGYKKVIGSKMVTGVTRSSDYVAIERTADFLAELTKEQDYQMSGAVSDNQIAKLGQQFGVRYVLVADVSEVFSTLFISARLIDVQTGLIKSSAEGSLTSDTIEGLTDLANALVYTLVMPDDAVKRIGPFTTYKALYDYKEQIPKGYKIASKQDIENIEKVYKMLGKRLSYPIYTSVECNSTSNSYSSFYVIYYSVYVQQLTSEGKLENITYSFRYNSDTGDSGHLNATSGGYIYVIKQQ